MDGAKFLNICTLILSVRFVSAQGVVPKSGTVRKVFNCHILSRFPRDHKFWFLRIRCCLSFFISLSFLFRRRATSTMKS